MKMEPVKILWRSKHPPTKKHRALLEEIYPGREFDIVHDSSWIAHADHVVQQFRSGKYDDLFVNASWSVLNIIVKSDVRPLIAIYEESLQSESDFYDGRSYKQIIELRRFNQMIVDHSKPQPYELRN